MSPKLPCTTPDIGDVGSIPNWFKCKPAKPPKA